MAIISDFYKRLRDLCEKRGMTVNELVKDLELSSGSPTAWKNGVVPRQSTLNRIAAYFDVAVDYLSTGLPASTTIGRKITQTVSRNIQFHREEANLTQKQFADILGVEESFVVGLESGQNALEKEMLYKICDTLHLLPGNFIPRDDENLTEDEEYLLSRRKKKAPTEAGECDILDDVDVAFYGDFKELNEDEKETVRDMVRLMRQRKEKRSQ